MSEMIRGTTPAIVLRFPEELRGVGCAVVRVVCGQGGRIFVQRDFEDFTIPDDGVLSVRLSQEESLRFRCGASAEVQVKCKFADGVVAASQIGCVPVGRVLCEEVL